MWWPHTKSGGYSVKSGCRQVWKSHEDPRDVASGSMGVTGKLWKAIWGAKVPHKIRVFMWKACHNGLPVKENLWKRRLAKSAECLICNAEDETVEHAILLCPWTRPMWFGMQLQCNPTVLNVTNFQRWME